MSKTQDEFLDHFARLGVFSKVQALMGSSNESDSDVIKSSDSIAKGIRLSIQIKRNIFTIEFTQVMIHQKMQKKFCKVKHITGVNGAYVVDGTVCMFGPIQLHWNYRTDRTDGFVSFQMENWRPCTPVVVRKMEAIVQVRLKIPFLALFYFRYRFSLFKPNEKFVNNFPLMKCK